MPPHAIFCLISTMPGLLCDLCPHPQWNRAKMEPTSCFCSAVNVMGLFFPSYILYAFIPRFIISTIILAVWQGWFKKSKDGQNCHFQHINATMPLCEEGQNCHCAHCATFQISDQDERSEAPKAVHCAALSKRPIIILVIFGPDQNSYWFRSHFNRHIIVWNS